MTGPPPEADAAAIARAEADAEPDAAAGDAGRGAGPRTSRADSTGRRASSDPAAERVDAGISFRTRLTIALVAAAVLPLASFGLVVVAAQRLAPDPAATVPRVLLLTIAIAALLAVLVAFALASDLTAPLRAIAAAVDRVSAGDLSTPIAVTGDDELARLAESHNRLAAELERRNRELGRILAALVAASPRDGVDWLIGRAAEDARTAFGMIDARILLVDPATRPARGARPRRGAAGPGRRCGPARSASACSSATCRRPGPGSGRTRTCSSCSRARSGSPSGTPSCSSGSVPRTPGCSSSTPPRTTSCAASATTSRPR